MFIPEFNNLTPRWNVPVPDAIKSSNGTELEFEHEDILGEIKLYTGVVIEAKVLGGEVVVNDNVQHATEAWFNKSIPEIEEYLLDGPSRFWRIVENSL